MSYIHSFFNNQKLISPHSDSLLLRTNFFLSKEKSDFRNYSQHLNKNFSQHMVFMPNLSMVRGPLCFGAPFLPQPVEFDLVNIGFPRCPKVQEDPVNGQLRFEDDSECELFKELMGKVFEGMVYNGDSFDNNMQNMNMNMQNNMNMQQTNLVLTSINGIGINISHVLIGL
jgi:hypothetical protein